MEEWLMARIRAIIRRAETQRQLSEVAPMSTNGRKLEIVPIGGDEFPRLVIKDDAGHVFDGKQMVADASKALVFISGQDIAFAFNAIQELLYEKYPLREFTVAMTVRVRAKETFTKQRLAEYLELVTSIYMDHEKGTGPVEDSTVQLGVVWAGLEEKKPVAGK
jgi:hypothetical protein